MNYLDTIKTKGYAQLTLAECDTSIVALEAEITKLDINLPTPEQAAIAAMESALANPNLPNLSNVKKVRIKNIIDGIINSIKNQRDILTAT